MRWLGFIILLAFVTLLNACDLMNYMAIGEMNVRPDLLLCIMVFFAINSDAHTAIVTSFLTGFALDVSYMAIGPYTISFGLAGSLLAVMDRDMIMSRVIRQGLTILIIGVISHGMAIGLTALKPGTPVPDTFEFLAWRSVYTAVIGPIVWMFLSAISPLFGTDRYGYGGA